MESDEVLKIKYFSYYLLKGTPENVCVEEKYV